MNLISTNKPIIYNAKIRWFDSLRGEGLVRLETGESVYIHFTAIKGIGLNNYHYPNTEDRTRLEDIKGRPCRVSLCDSGHRCQVETAIIEGV